MVGPTAMQELAPGLWRWTAAHPSWRPDATPGGPSDWQEHVGCVLYELPHVAVLIDPLLPARAETRERDRAAAIEAGDVADAADDADAGADGVREAFLTRLDELIAGRPVSILTTIRWHSRDRERLRERYRARTRRAWNAVPSGVVPKPLRGGGETLLWLPDVAALVVGDSLIGTDAGVRLCPSSWLTDMRVDRPGLAALMRPLLELPIERLLVSHGEPALHDGRAALAHAIDAALS